MPKYTEISEAIIELIKKDNLQQGDKLPSLNQLTKDFNVSKTTIVKSLEILQKNGVIFQVHGSGIFVRRNQKKGMIDLQTNLGFTSDLENENLNAKNIEFSVINPPRAVANELGISIYDEVFHVKRLRSMNDLVFCIEESYFKKTMVPYLNEEITSGSIFEYLKTAYNLETGFSDKYLSVSKLSNEEAQLLSLNENDPCQVTKELFYSTNGEPFDYSINTYNYQNAQFFLQITNN